ncbi:MAG: amidohydrolase family protein [Vulcanimicrobiaceae bacterium]
MSEFPTPRIIDLHSHWGTKRGWFGNPGNWFEPQGDAALQKLKKYFNWSGELGTEEKMAEDFRRSNVRAVLDLAYTTDMPMEDARRQHDYAFEVQRRYPDAILGHWIKLHPKDPKSLDELKRCIQNRVEFIGFGMSVGGPICTDPTYVPFIELCIKESIPVLITTGMTGAGAGERGGFGYVLDDTHPRHIDRLAANYPELTIIAARPAWPWQQEAIAILLHKGNVWNELHGWSPKYHPPELKREIGKRLQNKIMFGADYPMLSYDRLRREWRAEGYSEDVIEKVFWKNAKELLASLGVTSA